MAWHTRPGGVSAFPSGTAAQWAAAWFTPITDTTLNYLNDNLTFMRNPPFSSGETTPGTVSTSPGSGVGGWSSALSILTGTLTGYGGGKVYVAVQTQMLIPAGGGNNGFLFLRVTDGVTTRYVQPVGGLSSLATTAILGQNVQATAAYFNLSEVFIIDMSVLSGNISWDLRLGGVVNTLAKNTRLYIREM